MLKFQNVATSWIESAKVPAVLPPNASLTGKVEDGKTQIKSTEELTVPMTVEELVALATGTTDTVELTLGDKSYKVNVIVASFIRDQKLQSQQAMQAALRGDGKSVIRNNTSAWYLSLGPDKVADYLRVLSGTEKAKNAWLDQVYAENKAAIDTYSKR